MKLRLAERMARLGTETAFEVGARARALEAQGRPMIHLEIGEPDFDTPQNIRQAGCTALEEGYTHYSHSTGILELRLAIAEYAGRLRGLTFDPENVVVTPGAKPIMKWHPAIVHFPTGSVPSNTINQDAASTVGKSGNGLR